MLQPRRKLRLPIEMILAVLIIIAVIWWLIVTL